MIPSRWPRALWWLLFIPAFVIPVTGLEMLGRGGELGLGLTTLICLAIVVPMVIYLLCLRWRADARYDAVRALWPHGYLVEGLACDPTTAGLFAVGGQQAAEQAKRGYALVFDAEGARFYAGGRNAVEFLRIHWSQVVAVDTTTVTVPGGRQAAALTLRIVDDGRSATLPIVIKATKGLTGFRYSSPVEVQDHRRAVETLRGTRDARQPVPVAVGTADVSSDPSGRRALIPGIASTTMNLVGVAAFGFAALAFLAMLPFGILTWTHIWVAPTAVFLPLLFAGLFGVFVARMLWIFVPARERAELRAGYTLSNDGDLGVDQLDPRTGYVIRPAGGEALDRQQARTERQRVRALAVGVTAPANPRATAPGRMGAEPPPPYDIG